MDGCPLCGKEGTEVYREMTVHKGKLADVVTRRCRHLGFGDVTWKKIESLVIYRNEEERDRYTRSFDGGGNGRKIVRTNKVVRDWKKKLKNQIRPFSD